MSQRTYSSYGRQTATYFARPHVAPPTGAVDGPATWTGAALESTPEEWTVELDAGQIAELETAASTAIENGLPMDEVTAATFALPGLEADIADWRETLARGRGFLVVRRLPVERWDDALTSMAYWGLGHHIGWPGAQNPQGDLLGHVRDLGEEAVNPNVRRYRTAGNIDFHCDAADVVGLLCLATAARGGQSRIASSVAVYNRLAREAPELTGRLFEPVALDRRDEEPEGEEPVTPLTPCAFDGTTLRTFWHSEYFRSAGRHASVPPFTADEQRLLDTYDEIAARPDVHLDMWLQPGDMQFISNHTVIHARTAYEDSPEKQRHLLRLWLSLPGD